MIHPLVTANADVGYYYLPAKIKTVIVHNSSDLSRVDFFYSHAVFKKWEPGALLQIPRVCFDFTYCSEETLAYDVTITDKHGIRICTFLGFQIARHRLNHNMFDTAQHFDMVYQPMGVRLDNNAEVMSLPNYKPPGIAIAYQT